MPDLSASNADHLMSAGHPSSSNPRALTSDPEVTSHDLRALFQSIGQVSFSRTDLSTPPLRVPPETPVRLLDSESCRVDAPLLEVNSFVDGIQAALTLTHVQHRGVFLVYVAAGALAVKAQPLAVDERLLLVCSAVDEPWLLELKSTLPYHCVQGETPPQVASDVSAFLASTREASERRVVSDVVAGEFGGFTVIDGSLLARTRDLSLVGVVKTTRKRWLDDESFLYNLPQGWRSPRFEIVESGQSRFSCYLRLHDASHHSWDHGLVRLESFDPDVLDSLSATCLLWRQTGVSGDARWDRHLAPIRACEDFLRARRPPVFSF